MRLQIASAGTLALLILPFEPGTLSSLNGHADVLRLDCEEMRRITCTLVETIRQDD